MILYYKKLNTGYHSEKKMKAAVDVIGVRDVVKVMTDQSDNVTIQEHGCKILGNMAVEGQSHGS